VPEGAFAGIAGKGGKEEKGGHHLGKYGDTIKWCPHISSLFHKMINLRIINEI
jgi:hypothetical protein